ncbi:MAG TPA: hypothetical protein PKY87_11110 [Terricaulis sp.]|nr:hypothetical protein [Terricaulis sp.]
MRRTGLLPALALGLALWPGLSAAQSAEDRAAFARIERIGRDLYEHDRAAWLATDHARLVLPESERPNLRGWITLREGAAVIVDFVAERPEGLVSVHRSIFRNGGITEHGAVLIPLDEARQRAHAALAIAMTAPASLCDLPYNSAILPPEGEGEADADVYLLPATTVEGLVRIGGFARHSVDVDAQRVLETEMFSNSCLTGQTEPGAAFLYVTHVVSPLPTQAHVFLSLSHGITIFVGTPEGLFEITQGRIRRVRQ